MPGYGQKLPREEGPLANATRIAQGLGRVGLMGIAGMRSRAYASGDHAGRGMDAIIGGTIGAMQAVCIIITRPPR